MKRRPWFKFHTQDWRADPNLRMCSMAARGLWADMLSLMHEADPYGHLIVGGIAPSTEQLARLLSADPALIASLIGELSDNCVFSRNDDGVIFSRRMVRDAEIADEGRENVAKRWGKATKSKGVTSSPNRPPNRDPIAENGADPITKSQSQKSDISSSLRERAKIDLKLWDARLADAIAAAGSSLRPTNPAHRMVSVFRELCEPMSGEPCDWDRDVMPAIQMAAARNASFDKWDYIRPAAIANRDRRLAGLPAPQAPQPLKTNGASNGRGTSSLPSDDDWARAAAAVARNAAT